MLTAEQLQSIMPGLTAKRRDDFLPFLVAAMEEFAIEPPSRAAAFLAQLAHESGQLRFMEEIWGPTDAQRRYEPVTTLSRTLGNTEVGDGKRFKGRGPIQLTGRANYQRFGDLLGVDLVTQPTRAAGPDVAFRIAGLFWSKKGLNELADLATDDAFKEITRRINGGFNGLADRQAFYAVARDVLGVAAAPIAFGVEPSDLPRAAPGAEDLTFERGAEAIRVEARKRPQRKAAKATKAAKAQKAAKAPKATKAAPKRTAKQARRRTAKKKSSPSKRAAARTRTTRAAKKR